MNMIQKLKKNKKGFTLVELLVVLVILAILAAAIIPSMMGFIDKAKEESNAAECRNVILAGDVLMNELYGKGTLKAGDSLSNDEITKIAGVKGTVSDVTVAADGTRFYINGAKYKTADNKRIYTFSATSPTNGTWTGANVT